MDSDINYNILTGYDTPDIVYNHLEIKIVNDFTIKLHAHDFCELIYLEEGKTIYISDGKSYTVPPKHIIITPPGCYHKIKFRKNTLYRKFDLLFNLQLVNYDIDEFTKTYGDVINVKDNTFIFDLFSRFDYYKDKLEGEELETAYKNLLNEIFLNIKISGCPALSSEETVLNNIISYIDDRVTEGIDLQKICDEFHISRSYLHKLFAGNFKSTPKNYILIKKVTSARKKIREGLSAIKASEMYGFNDYSSFYRAYKRVFGIAPSEEPETITNKEYLLYGRNLENGGNDKRIKG